MSNAKKQKLQQKRDAIIKSIRETHEKQIKQLSRINATPELLLLIIRGYQSLIANLVSEHVTNEYDLEEQKRVAKAQLESFEVLHDAFPFLLDPAFGGNKDEY